MSDQLMIFLGVMVGLLITIVIPFLVASPKLRRKHKDAREQWFRDHPDYDRDARGR